MRPITSRPCVSDNRSVRGGSYRLFDLMVIGAMLIGLTVIGLAGVMVIRPIKVSNISGRDIGQSPENSKISENIIDYYPGVLGQLRLARGFKWPDGTKPDCPGLPVSGQSGHPLLPGRDAELLDGF